jgi:hypothetical protein
MAEPASAIVGLTTLTLKIIYETAKFIRDAREVDRRIQKLRDKLLDLQYWVELIDSTCKEAQGHNEPVPERLIVSLTNCEETLQGVQAILEGLASKKSGTFVQKVKLKIRTESSEREILEAIDDLKHHKSQIKNHMNIWTHQRTADIHRRTSEATQPLSISPRVLQTNVADTPTPYRTLSNASTILEPIFDEPFSAGSSPLTTHSRLSHESSTSHPLRPLSEINEDASSCTALGFQIETSTEQRIDPLDSGGDTSDDTGPDTGPDSVDLHHEISKYKNEETRAQVIRQILERHPRSTVLVNTKDEYGHTPLCRAAQLGDLRLAHTLVEFSADINARDSEPRSVLDHALARNGEDFVKFLLECAVNEKNVSSKYRDRLEEIKEAVEYARKKSAKQKAKGKSKSAFTMNAGARTLPT